MSHAISNTSGGGGLKPLMAHGSVLQLGISNGKIGMWLFLGSEVMFFTGLIGAYIILRFGQVTWADPTGEGYPLNIPLTAANTFLLICSSVTLVWALQSIQAGKRGLGNLGLLLTTVFGAVFVGVQGVEYYELYTHRGMSPSSDLFGSCFYTMTGFHGMHVAVGVIAMGVLTAMGFAGKFDEENYAAVEMTGLYWHFVDLVWIILFAIVYLM
jgi:heme/copper-type cytochrome/quinol oxidase subunit 3